MPLTFLALALWTASLAAPQIRTGPQIRPGASQDLALDEATDRDERPLQDASVVPA